MKRTFYRLSSTLIGVTAGLALATAAYAGDGAKEAATAAQHAGFAAKAANITPIRARRKAAARSPIPAMRRPRKS